MNIKVPLYDITTGSEELEAIKATLDKKWISQGPATEKLERKFSELLGIKTMPVAVNSGTAALHTALHSLGIGPGDEVIVPSMTFVATAASVVMVGAKPVFADSKNLSDFSICPESLIEKINRKTKAIVAVHYAGYPADMERIIEIAKTYDLKIIEDVAHGPLLNLDGKSLGTMGDVGCFSFFSTKNVTTAEGGMVVSPHEEVIQKARLFRSHYMRQTPIQELEKYSNGHYDVDNVGFNYRLNDISASIGLVQLDKYNKSQIKRIEVVRKYRELLNNYESYKVLIPYLDHKIETSTHHLFPIILLEIDRREVALNLQSMGIQTSIHYPACHLFSYYKKFFGTKKGDCPVAEKIANCELSLPMHPNLTEDQINYVFSCLKEIIGV